MAGCALLPSLPRAAPGEAFSITGEGRVFFQSEQKLKVLVSRKSTALRKLMPTTYQWCMRRSGFPPRYARRRDEITEPNRKQKESTNRGNVVTDAALQDSLAPTEDQGAASVRSEFSVEASAKVLVIFGEGTISPFGGASWEEVMQQTARRIGWIDSSFEMVVLSDGVARSSELKNKIELLVQQSNIMMVINVKNDQSQQWLRCYSGRVPTQISFDCSPDLETYLGGSNLSSVGILDELTAALPGNKLADKRKVLTLVREAWERQSPDNLCFAVLVLIDSVVTPVKLLKNLRATGLASLQCMIKNCGQQVLNCLMDPNCRKALDCLNNCAPTDQIYSCNQIGRAKGSLWYDPVFQVRTLGGQTVWRRRHYRVIRSATPGTFYFSVLDNGVISKEFWRIVYVADDLSWGLFYYSGAAAAAGQSYTGAVLVTPDGAWPDNSQAEVLNAAFEACGIKLWELYRVVNSPSSEHESAPLGLPEDAKLRR
ncbi:hypothetical protein R1flu_019277 [Riccia fluitans]|uniref:VDE lipocalin domain-containing protein n=1 Tax=Riccia fluitans TaxID=41844 RepID=A0ABD1ZI76_9MARC